MKKLLLFTLVSTVSVLFAQAQQYLETDSRTVINDRAARASGAVNLNKTTACGPDTVGYTFQKATALNGFSLNNATSARTVAQYFDCPQPITISGAEFYSYKIDETGGISNNVQLSVYLAGPDSVPTGSALASVAVPVDTVFGTGLLTTLIKRGNFTPVTVSQPYCLVLENNSPNGVVILTSDYEVNDGAGEWLGSAQLTNQSAWLRSYELAFGPSILYDADLLIEPYVTYDITAGFTQASECIGEDGTGAWTNTSSPILANRMYNFAVYVGLGEFSYAWDYGDGSAYDYEIDGAHTYSGTGPWTVTLNDTMYGWRTTCIDAYSMSTGDPVSNVDFSVPGNGSSMTYTFGGSADGSGTLEYDWDFGDGNTANGVQNPNHTFASANTYNVCLTVTNDCGSVQHCGNVTADMATGIADISRAELLVYPNPSEGIFTISLKGFETEGTINVLDVSGRVVYTEGVTIGDKFSKSLNLDVAEGTYLLQLVTNEGTVTKRLSVQ